MITKQKVEVTKKEGATTSFFYLDFLVDTARCKNLEQAVRHVSAEYMGKKIKENIPNGLVFNWLDFWHNVPNDLCWEHGFQKDCIEMPTLHADYSDILFLENPVSVAYAS